MKNKIQIDTLKDKSNFALHFAANATVLGATIAYGNASSIYTLVTLGGICGLKELFWPRLKPRLMPEVVGLNKNNITQRAKKRLAKRLELSRVPELYLFNGIFTAREMAACVSETKDIVISPVLLKTMSLREQMAVVAHELVHIKADHNHRLNSIKALGVAASAVTLGNGLIWTFKDRLSMRTLLALAETGGLTYLCVAVAAIVASNYSQQTEYQSDRGAGQLTSRAAMASALEVLRDFKNSSGWYGVWDTEGLSISGRALNYYMNRLADNPVTRFLDSHLASHPPLEKRIEKLRSTLKLPYLN